MEKKQVKIYLSEEVHKALKVQAAIEGTNLSEMFERLAEKYLAEKKSP